MSIYCVSLFWGEDDYFFLSFCGLDNKVLPGVCFQKVLTKANWPQANGSIVLQEFSMNWTFPGLERTLNWPEDTSCKIPGRSISYKLSKWSMFLFSLLNHRVRSLERNKLRLEVENAHKLIQIHHIRSPNQCVDSVFSREFGGVVGPCTLIDSD